MPQQNIDQSSISHEKAIHRYVKALDEGDMAAIAEVLNAALDDPELEQAITDINLAYQEEEQITPIATDAEVIRNLLREHFPSAFEDMEEFDNQPLTVGEVAARLQVDRQVLPADQEVNRRLLKSLVPLPAWLSVQVIQQLATQLNVKASDRFWERFRDTAIALAMGRSHDQAQLAAAREERRQSTKAQPKSKQTSPTPKKTRSKKGK